MNIVQAKQWKHKPTGRTASTGGAQPWTGAPGNRAEDWEIAICGLVGSNPAQRGRAEGTGRPGMVPDPRRCEMRQAHAERGKTEGKTMTLEQYEQAPPRVLSHAEERRLNQKHCTGDCGGGRFQTVNSLIRNEYGRWVDEGELTGSEKQVAWAKEIRRKAVADYLSGKERNQQYLDTRADTEEAGWREGLNDPDEGIRTAAKEALKHQEERWLAETHRDALKHLQEAEGGRAAFWIDRRGMSFDRPGEAEGTIRRLAMKPDPATGRFRRMIRKKTLVDQAGQPVPKLFGD